MGPSIPSNYNALTTAHDNVLMACDDFRTTYNDVRSSTDDGCDEPMQPQPFEMQRHL